MSFDIEIPIPIEYQYVNDYYHSGKPMIATTKYVMDLRRKLREFTIAHVDEPKLIEEAVDEYYSNLRNVYYAEKDMLEVSDEFVKNNVLAGVSSLYHYLSKTKMLWNIPRKGMYNNRLPFNKIDLMEPDWLNSWWKLVFIELEEDPREVLKDSFGFKEINGDTKIDVPKSYETHKNDTLKGLRILRRESEVYSGNSVEGGLILLYIWVKDNESDRLPTKTVFCFSVDHKSECIRVYPLILNVNR